MEKLRDEHDETANLGILKGDSVIYLDIAESKRGVRLAANRGDRDLVHSTALGKAVAVHLPEERVRGMLQRTGLPPPTPNQAEPSGRSPGRVAVAMEACGRHVGSRLAHRPIGSTVATLRP